MCGGDYLKKTKLFKSFLSFILTGVFMFTVFTSISYKQPTAADVKINGVKGRIYEFSENIIDKLYTEDKVDKTPHEAINQKVYLGGYPVGLKLYADGVVVVDTESVDTENGMVDTAKNAGIKIGDIIKKVNNEVVTSNVRVAEIIEKSKGEPLNFYVLRDNEYLNLTFKTAYSVSEGKYKAGIWIRDSSAGIGTVTFCTEEGLFSSLGHAVCDIDTKSVIPISEGETTDVTIININKGTTGAAGEICGYLENNTTGEVYYNGDLGVYGKFYELPSTPTYSIASKYEVEKGEAKIYTTIESGVIEEFAIEITDVIVNEKENKNLVIKVTDPLLIEKTGGIVQGMSGSPIIQNGKLIGAVTHVFLNDSTGGYGIFAETMLENTRYIEQNQTFKEAG